jgi:hypothetical protein
MNVNRVSNNQKPDAFQRASIDHDALRTRLLAGVNVPESPRITAVIEYAQRH